RVVRGSDKQHCRDPKAGLARGNPGNRKAGTKWRRVENRKQNLARRKILRRVAGKPSVTYIERVGHCDRKHQDQGAKKCGSSGATRKRDNHPTRTSLFVSPQAKSAIRTVRSCSTPKTSKFRNSGHRLPPTSWRRNISAKPACRL